jgi:formylglycine-generating enzyme required for sulfatase activity
MVRDFVLFRPRTVRFSYALSPEGSTQLAGPGVITGTKKCVLNESVNFVVTRGKANDEFDRFAEDLGLRFWFENGTVSRCDLFMGGNPVGKPPADLRFDEIKEFASSLLGSTQRASDLATGSIVVMQNKYQPKGRACKILIDAIEPPLSSRQTPTGTAQAKPPVSEMETLTNSIGMKLRLIPAGGFTMGDDSGDADERPAHRVTITKPFYLATHEVTNDHYRRVMGDVQSAWKADDHPVETVSWEDAVTFCRELSNLPEERRTGRVYRLPTEAEWEYACRAGTATRYSCGDTERDLDAFAWFPWGANQKTHAVGQKKPNDWGLFDMHGNVWEWTGDWYSAGYYAEAAGSDPQGPPGGSFRVIKGGSWNDSARLCRSAVRFSVAPSDKLRVLGFRIALGFSGPQSPDSGR